MDKRKELKTMYKQTLLPTGIYQIKNLVNGKVFIGSSKNLPAIFNRHKFQLNNKSHPNKTLQADWATYGADAFSYDVLENLKIDEMPPEEISEALEALEEKWLVKLQPYDQAGYNKRPK